MARARNRHWISASIPILAAVALTILSPTPCRAIPAFARKYNVKCYSCHLIPPVLNKTGYMFKRLGYRMPPDEMDKTTPPPKIVELDRDIRFTITNSLALLTQGSFTAEKAAGDNPASKTSFNLDEATIFAAGSVPQSGFSYFVQYAFHLEGGNKLEQARAEYTGGRADSSFFGKVGEMHLQEDEGTRGAMLFGLFPEAPFILTNTNALNFTLDQSPVGVNAGYTWASAYFRQILGLSAKVTNGVNADGSEILSASSKNSKDAWFDADYWFGPDGGITFMTYYGRKDQIQNQGTPDQFTYHPTIRRYGVFANYLFFDKLDIIGGYLRSRDDWRDTLTSPKTDFITNGYRGEVDFYFRRGTAVMGRYDRLTQTIAGGPAAHSESWAVGGLHALTEVGNLVIRATYKHERDTDPVSRSLATDKLFTVDLRLMW